MKLGLSKNSKRIVIKIGTNSIMKSIDKINYHIAWWKRSDEQ